ncbi:hypothetical protein Dimus_028464 [Dionaea muscipula]
MRRLLGARRFPVLKLLGALSPPHDLVLASLPILRLSLPMRCLRDPLAHELEDPVAASLYIYTRRRSSVARGPVLASGCLLARQLVRVLQLAPAPLLCLQLLCSRGLLGRGRDDSCHLQCKGCSELTEFPVRRLLGALSPPHDLVLASLPHA